TREKSLLAIEDVVEFVEPAIAKMHEEMYQAALNHVQTHTNVAKTYDEFKQHLKNGGYIKMSVSGQDAEIQIKAETGATARVIVNEPLLTEICPVTGKPATMTILFARAY
ncbi:MAG TPA: proline--tRNA ligase, partial [Acholeplasma sp.]|nr:proline--tRNA ligase [Acholeplasma sp.]